MQKLSAQRKRGASDISAKKGARGDRLSLVSPRIHSCLQR